MVNILKVEDVKNKVAKEYGLVREGYDAKGIPNIRKATDSELKIEELYIHSLNELLRGFEADECVKGYVYDNGPELIEGWITESKLTDGLNMRRLRILCELGVLDGMTIDDVLEVVYYCNVCRKWFSHSGGEFEGFESEDLLGDPNCYCDKCGESKHNEDKQYDDRY